MNINRHNYEEFFLLYADNELPADQRRAVEDFVKQNPDLKEELDLLKDLRLEPDTTIFFDNKESLLQPVSFKDDAAAITEDEEKILSFIDFELSAAETTELKQKLADNPGLRAELELFTKTKIQPDLSVVFPDKSLLYRSSQEKTPVIRMTWVRVAVAAAIILIAGLLWINNSVDETVGTGPLAGVTETTTGNKNTVGGEKPIPAENNAGNKADGTENTQQVMQDQQPSTALASIPNAVKANKKTQVNNRPAEQAGMKEAAPQVLAANDNPQNQAKKITTPGNEQSLVNVSPNLSRANEIIDRPVTEANVKSDYATEALMSAQDAVEVVTLENSNIRKGPFRGIVRKANRLFNKVTNPDMDKPLVRVANFEIALAK
jgi:anti-sigma factor RsiW